jgi:IPT/TIG domain-containing protein
MRTLLTAAFVWPLALAAGAETLYTQPPNPAGGLHQSSWRDPDGSNNDWYVWDSFTLPQAATLTDIRWQGGYQYGGSLGGPVFGFDVSICASIAANTEPDVVNPPLMHFYEPSNAGETPAGTYGGTAMFDYHVALPVPFQAQAGIKYWVHVYASEPNPPEWGFADATGGDGSHYRRWSEYMFQFAPGDTVFTLIGNFVAPPPTIASVLPATGSEAGGERVTILGSGFGTLGDTTLAIGGAPATLIDVVADRIQATTPAGTGTVSVAVTTPSGTATSPGAYAYVAPILAARFGNVNQGAGDREDVLFVNDGAGDTNRVVVLPRSSPFTIRMAVPSTRTISAFALYGWVGMPGAGNVTAMPFGLGSTVYPTPLTRMLTPQPREIWNNAGHTAQLGVATRTSTPAPSIVLVSTHPFSRSLRATFQGFVRDGGSQIAQGFSITNAVILDLQ